MSSPQPIRSGRGPQSPGRTASADSPPPLQLSSEALSEILAITVVQEFQEAWQKFQVTAGTTWIPGVLRESDWNISAGFSETQIPLSDSALDLNVAQGASLCFGLSNRDGKVAIPRPIALNGFSAGLWIFSQPLRAIQSDASGRVGVTAPCFDGPIKDITQSVLASPLGALFPSGRIESPSLEALLELLSQYLPSRATTPSQEANALSGLISHLDRIAISANFYLNAEASPEEFLPAHGGMCVGNAASFDGVFHLPSLKKNLRESGFKEFNFTGLEKLSLHWPRFPLKDLLGDTEFRVRAGDLDVDLQKTPGSRFLEAVIRFKDLSITHAGLWGDDPLHLNGKLRVILQPGGILSLEPKDLEITLPVFPSRAYPVSALSARLNGSVNLREGADGAYEALRSNLELTELSLETYGDKRVQAPFLPGEFQGEIKGKISLDYDPSHPVWNLISGFDLGGEIRFFPDDFGKIEEMQLKDARLEGTVTWFREDRGFFPLLSTSTLNFTGDLSVKQKGSELIKAEGVFLRLLGDPNSSYSPVPSERASFNTGAEGIYVGQFAWKPEIALQLESWGQGENYLLEGKGDWRLDSLNPKKILAKGARIIPPKTDLGSSLYFSTDTKDFYWSADMDRPQTLGPLQTTGSLKVEGLNDTLQIKTLEPLTLLLRKREFVKQLQVNGTKDENGFSIRLDTPALAEKVRASMGISLLDEGRLAGTYTLVPLTGVLPAGKSVSLSTAKLTGSFSTPPWEEMLENPVAFVKGRALARLKGSVRGPIAADYRAHLSYRPAVESMTPQGPVRFPPSIQIVFNRARPSRIQWGPLKGPDGEEWLRGGAKLRGTMVFGLGEQRVHVAGWHLGLEAGELFWKNQEEAALSDFTLEAEQFWGFHKGMILGRGFRFESNLNLNALLAENSDGVEPEALQRHLLYIADHQPLNLEAFWRMLRNHLTALPTGKEDAP